MNDLGRFALIWLTVLSLLAFILFAQDKFKARHGRWRISEAALWAVAILGGGVGSPGLSRLAAVRRASAPAAGTAHSRQLRVPHSRDIIFVEAAGLRPAHWI